MTTGTSRQRSATHNQALGSFGERVAERHLVEAGMVLLDRNWRCAEGELDLVLRDGQVLVACEVKTRSTTTHGHPHEAITDDKLARLLSLGERWAEAHRLRPPEIRVDLVAVLRPATGPTLVEHVRGLV